MPPTDRSFNRTDLLLAWFSQRKYRAAHDDLRTYHDAKFAAFSKAFRVDLNASPDKDPFSDEDGLHGLLLNVAGSYEKIGSPFSGYLCGTRAISEMYQKFHEELDNAATVMRAVHINMMTELIEQIWGEDVPHRVDQKDIEAFGHPGWDAPDPIDYW